MNKDYLNYTDYHLEPAGLRRVDFVVNESLEYAKGKSVKDIKVLDAGCGNGNLSLPLASLGFNVTGVDLDEKSIEVVSKKNKFSNAEFIVKDVRDIKEKYDIIIANEIFEHIPDPKSFAKLLHTKLKDNGILLISVPNGWSLEESLRFILNFNTVAKNFKNKLKKNILEHQTIQSYSHSPHIHFFSWGQFKELLVKAGFKVIKRKNISIVFKQAYYIFLRMFLKRENHYFAMLNAIDEYFAEMAPGFIGDGWMIVVRKK